VTPSQQRLLAIARDALDEGRAPLSRAQTEQQLAALHSTRRVDLFNARTANREVMSPGQAELAGLRLQPSRE
jgi:hypothetical protein